jgi:hypothetical protein
VKALSIFLLATTLFLGLDASAKKIEVKTDKAAELPEKEDASTGKEEASKYFSKRSVSSESTSSGPNDRYLALHMGGYLAGDAYVWGRQDKVEEVGKFNAGVSYRIGEWINSADMLMRIDFSSYEIDDVKPVKMAVIFAATFPDSNSKFPLYFGGGIGPGFFFKQARSESPISIDYQLFGGVRFFNVMDSSVGLFAEAGIKNHFHLLSDGQFNGTFLATGVLFTF